MFNILNGNPITIYGDGTQRRAFSYIDDCLQPLWNAATSPEASCEIINLGGIQEVEIREAARLLSEVVGGADIVRLEPRHEVKHAWSTWQKSVDLLGFKYKTSLESGLRQMWEWAQLQPQRERTAWSQYELYKGLYEYWKVPRGDGDTA